MRRDGKRKSSAGRISLGGLQMRRMSRLGCRIRDREADAPPSRTFLPPAPTCISRGGERQKDWTPHRHRHRHPYHSPSLLRAEASCLPPLLTGEMGRRPHALIQEFFDRGPKLDDNSNRYQHTCKRCGEFVSVK